MEDTVSMSLRMPLQGDLNGDSQDFFLPGELMEAGKKISQTWCRRKTGRTVASAGVCCISTESIRGQALNLKKKPGCSKVVALTYVSLMSRFVNMVAILQIHQVKLTDKNCS